MHRTGHLSYSLFNVQVSFPIVLTNIPTIEKCRPKTKKLDKGQSKSKNTIEKKDQTEEKKRK